MRREILPRVERRLNVSEIVKIPGVPFVWDSRGIMWVYLKDEQRITVMGSDGIPAEGGFFCTSIENGIEELIIAKYIDDHSRSGDCIIGKKESEEKTMYKFDLVIDGIDKEKADHLLDIIIAFAESHRAEVAGGVSEVKDDGEEEVEGLPER